jgi:hypothetical protein
VRIPFDGRLQRPIWIGAGIVWMALVVYGMSALMQYDNSPGKGAEAPSRWPPDSAIAADPQGPTLLMLAHPRCDCTRASITELAELLARSSNRPRTYVVFIKPAAGGRDWEQTSLWRSAADIPGVTVVRDDEGNEARRFGVRTSGQVLLYDAAGRLQYSGGATASRGKAGDNLGRESILRILNGEAADVTRPVFGCALFSPADAPATPIHDHATHSN